MAKKSKHKASKHTVAPGFPAVGNPMDVADHPVANMPSPQGGQFDGQQMMAPGAPMLPGEGM